MLATLICLIVGISDGDTLTARCPTQDADHPYQQVKVRLADSAIDLASASYMCCRSTTPAA